VYVLLGRAVTEYRWDGSRNILFMRHKLLVLTVKNFLQSVYIYGSYCKIKTGVPFFFGPPGMSADVDLDTVGSCILFYCMWLFACNIRSYYRFRALYELYVEADQPPCRWSRNSCSWESYGEFPRRNSKGPEPRGSREFTTVYAVYNKPLRKIYRKCVKWVYKYFGFVFYL